jgi:phospholipid/cholesterol/gamma-HCH transport system substrate-binding protein
VRWLTRFVQLAVILTVVAGVVLLINAKIPRPHTEGKFRTYADFRDGSKLATGSPVVIAGVRVGEITKLSVDGRMARIDMKLRDGLDLPADSFATRRADSLFGDSYIEIIPTAVGEGAAPERLLKSGEPLTHVIEGDSTDALLRGIDKELPRIENALDTVHSVMLEGRKRVNGPYLDRMTEIADWLGGNNIEGPIERVDSAVTRLDDLSTRGAAALAHQAPEVMRKLDSFDGTVTRARENMRTFRSSLSQAMADARSGVDKLDEPVGNMLEVVAAVDQGRGEDWRGTLGRLINSPHLADEIEDATESLKSATSSLNRFRSWIGFRGEYDIFSRASRFYATAEIRARADKFYLIEAERGPLGGVPLDQLTEAVGQAGYVRSQEIHDETRFTAQFGKDFGPLAIRGGLKDSTFGMGVDGYIWGDRLKLSADVFGSFTPTPRVKLTAAWSLFRTVYILGGVDDALNSPGYLPIIQGADVPKSQFNYLRYGRDYFLGATLVVSDEDIATLLRVYGAALISAAL